MQNKNNKMIKNVIFDLGRVIYNYWPYEYLLTLGYDSMQADKLMQCIFDNPLWLEIDKGTYSIQNGIDKMCLDYPAQSEDIKRVLDSSWVDMVLTLIPESVGFFFEVKNRGYKIYILSNFGADAFEHVRARDSFLFDEADGIVVSAYEKSIKPSFELYNCLIKRYNLLPDETLFIDDSEKNVGAAKSLGIRGIVFTGIEDCRMQFELIIK